MKRPKPLFAAILVLGGIFVLIQLIGLLGMSGIFGSGDPYDKIAFPLSGSEKAWKDQIERQYKCELKYFGPDIDSREDTAIIVTFELRYESRLAALLDKDMEAVAEKIGDAYLRNTDTSRKQTRLLFLFNNWHSGEIATSVPQSRQCTYNLQTASVVPGIKKLVIPYYSFCYIHGENQQLWVKRLGAHRKNDFYFGDFEKLGLEKSNSGSYKGLDSCETLETTIPQLIPVKKGHLQAQYQFVLHKSEVISVVITYQCYPGNRQFTYADVVRKLRRPLKSREEQQRDGLGTCAEYLNPNLLNYEVRNHGVLIKTTTDTTSIPWMIRYETSLDSFRYFN